MVVVRLSRAGTTKLPFYRIVVTDHRAPRDGNHLENLGTWDPRLGDGKLVFNQTRYEHWRKRGAKPSLLLKQILARQAKAAAAAAKKAS